MINEIRNASPLVANFIRGFMAKALMDDSLRACGQAGMDAVESAGLFMSEKTISNITKNMVKWGVIEKVRNGKHFVVQQGELFEDLVEWLEEPPEDWGKTRTEEEWPDRLQATRIIKERKGVIFDEKKDRIPKGGWGQLNAAFKGGRLRSAYVPEGVTLYMVWRDENDKVQKEKVQTWTQLSETN